MNLSIEVNEAIERAVKEHSHPDELVGYLANMTVANNEAGIPAVVTVIALRLNAAVPGEYITQAFFVDTPIPTYEEVVDHIRDLLTKMRTARIAHMRRILEQADAVTADERPYVVKPEPLHTPGDCPAPESCMEPHATG